MSNSSWLDSLTEEERDDIYINFWKYKNMTHKEIRDTIVGGLHFLTTTELVNLHAEISRVQIEHSHDEQGGPIEDPVAPI